MSGSGGGKGRWESRRRAREAALRMLYEAEIGRLPIVEAIRTQPVIGGEEAIELDEEARAYAAALAAGAVQAQSLLDHYIADAARHWRVERMAVIDRLLLRLAVQEMIAHPGTPPRVAIDEAIELARVYSGEDAARFVNGVLDAIFRKLKEEGRVVD